MGWELASVTETAVWPVMVAVIFTVSRRRPGPHFCQTWFAASIGSGIGPALARDPVTLSIAGANVLAAALSWWWSRRRRDRAPRAYGAKTKAVIAAMARVMRESARPRPRVQDPAAQGMTGFRATVGLEVAHSRSYLPKTLTLNGAVLPCCPSSCSTCGPSGLFSSLLFSWGSSPGRDPTTASYTIRSGNTGRKNQVLRMSHRKRAGLSA